MLETFLIAGLVQKVNLNSKVVFKVVSKVVSQADGSSSAQRFFVVSLACPSAERTYQKSKVINGVMWRGVLYGGYVVVDVYMGKKWGYLGFY